MEALYLLCIEARNNGQTRIPVTIYPALMNSPEFITIQAATNGNSDKINLWSDLKTVYEFFETNHRVPEITFLGNGLTPALSHLL